MVDIKTQVEKYEKDITEIQQRIGQLNIALQRTIGAREALLHLLKESEDEPATES